MIMSWFSVATRSRAPVETLLIRIAVGVVFASEGIQKFLYPETRGAGRFAKIGLPAPEFLGTSVGTVELTCGLLVLVGLFTRAAALPLTVIMLVAIASTKLPILLGHGYWIFAYTSSTAGFWSFLHESRTDLAMLLCSIFLCAVGAGPWSVDHSLHRSR